ncbi:MAG: DUF1611 domain-containing protein, partial [Methanobacterium sp.]|nr:DUF1611 domain-containing protein [Methanobacterium sp.]
NEQQSVFERPAKVVAISLNSADFNDRDYREAVRRLEDETGLVVVDPCRESAGPLVDALSRYSTSLLPRLVGAGR